MLCLRNLNWAVESAPRVVVHLASLAALGAALGACVVPQQRYEEAVSAAQVEQAGHRHALAELYAVEQKLALAEAALRELELRLGDGEHSVAEARLQTSMVGKERDSATELVEQLRGELARVGDHLKVYATARDDLRSQLEAAEARAARLATAAEHIDQLGGVVRDLSVLLGEPVGVGEMELEIREGRAIVRIDASRVWAGESGELLEDGQKVVEVMGKVALAHPGTRFELAEPGSTGEASLRLRKLVDALAAHGIAADRAVIRVQDPPAPAQAPVPATDAVAEASPGREPALEIAVELSVR